MITTRLSKKISLATFMNITGQWSSTNYQITNYGLGGMCENHIDPHGYIEGADLPIERNVSLTKLANLSEKLMYLVLTSDN